MLRLLQAAVMFGFVFPCLKCDPACSAVEAKHRTTVDVYLEEFESNCKTFTVQCISSVQSENLNNCSNISTLPFDNRIVIRLPVPLLSLKIQFLCSNQANSSILCEREYEATEIRNLTINSKIESGVYIGEIHWQARGKFLEEFQIALCAEKSSCKEPVHYLIVPALQQQVDSHKAILTAYPHPLPGAYYLTVLGFTRKGVTTASIPLQIIVPKAQTIQSSVENFGKRSIVTLQFESPGTPEFVSIRYCVHGNCGQWKNLVLTFFYPKTIKDYITPAFPKGIHEIQYKLNHGGVEDEVVTASLEVSTRSQHSAGVTTMYVLIGLCTAIIFFVPLVVYISRDRMNRVEDATRKKNSS